jgi:hypothetical protein
MLARLLAALPSVRTARDLAVAQDRLQTAEQRIRDLVDVGHLLLKQRTESEAKYDRLVEARLYRQGDIASPVITQAKTPVPAAAGPFATFSRTFMGTNGIHPPEPVGDDDMG